MPKTFATHPNFQTGPLPERNTSHAVGGSEPWSPTNGLAGRDEEAPAGPVHGRQGMIAYPSRFTYRRRGLPKRLRRIGVEGLVSACDIHIIDGHPAAKVAVFRNRTALRRFYRDVLPRYRGAESLFVDSLGRQCLGVVNKLSVEILSMDSDEYRAEVDRRYFCFVGLVEGFLSAEVLSHEAVHVGFAWDYRFQGKGVFQDPHNPEENVCYPAGRWLDSVLSFIKDEGLREV